MKSAQRNSRLRKHYGVSTAEFSLMVDKCGNACEVCGDIFIKTPNIDHCHRTGKVCGLLCQRCNLSAGHLDDDPSKAKLLHEYLLRTRI